MNIFKRTIQLFVSVGFIIITVLLFESIKNPNLSLLVLNLIGVFLLSMMIVIMRKLYSK